MPITEQILVWYLATSLVLFTCAVLENKFTSISTNNSIAIKQIADVSKDVMVKKCKGPFRTLTKRSSYNFCSVIATSFRLGADILQSLVLR